MLVYDGRYYLIGEGHKEFVGEKSQDDDFYLLTLAAVAMELHDEGLTEVDVFLAAGLPLMWTANQKEAFAAYLSRNEDVRFVWKKVAYHIRIKAVPLAAPFWRYGITSCLCTGTSRSGLSCRGLRG